MSQLLRENTDFIQLDEDPQKDTILRRDNRSLQNETQEIQISPCSISRQDFELEAQRSPSRNRVPRSKIAQFFGGYCEMTVAASDLRKKWIVLLSVFACSKAALEIKENKRLIPLLFAISYACLGSHIVEDLLRYRSLKTANSAHQKVECLFKMTDKTVIILFIASLNLCYSGVLNEVFLLLSPVLFLLEIRMYLKNEVIKQSDDKDVEVIGRVFYLLQSFLIAAKMNNIIDPDWKWTLMFIWIYLGLQAAFVILTGFLFGTVSFTAIINTDTETLRLIKNKIIGYIWHISYDSLINIIGFVILVGIFQKIESNEDDTFETGLRYAKMLSLFLVIYVAVLFPILKKFHVSPFEELRTTLQNHIAFVSQKKYTLVKTDNNDEKKIAFFLMVSPTYFSLLSEISQAEFEKNYEASSTSQENLCYICENNEANVILTECGHGGVCCDCVMKLIEQKNECMGCRKPVKAIYKIENNNSKYIQAFEVAQILEEV